MKKKFLVPLTCASTAVAALTPLSALTSCGSHLYDKLSETLYQSLITEFVGSELAKEIVGDSVDTGIDGITSIPRPSGSLDGIRNYILDRLEKLAIPSGDIHNNLDYITEDKDKKYSSLWFDIPASNDGENLPKIILQAHMDLVFAFDKDRFHETYEQEEDPIATEWNPDAVYDASNNSIHTKNYCTSLGADNGIGIALMLALAKHRGEDGFKHGPIRCIITADEEEGMKGANVLSCGKLCVDEVELLDNSILSSIIDSPYLINIDNETVGEIVTSCAGGIGSHYRQCLKVTPADPIVANGTDWNRYHISISGLKGGHSGSDINYWHANAIKMAGQILDYCDTEGISIISMKTPGIEAYNSIPDKCEFTFSCPLTEEQVQDACEYVRTTTPEIYHGESYDDIKIIPTPLDKDSTNLNGLSPETSKCVYTLIEALWFGPYSWSDEEKKIVKTSANIGPINLNISQDVNDLGTHKADFTLSSYSRSQLTSDVKFFDTHNHNACSALLGSKIYVRDVKDDIKTDDETYIADTIYPGWEKGTGSEKIHDLATKSFKMFGATPEDADIHGGVEPAWWSDVYATLTEDEAYKEIYKDWSLTALGPTIKYCHNPKEEIYLETLTPIIKTVLYLLENIAN